MKKVSLSREQISEVQDEYFRSLLEKMLTVEQAESHRHLDLIYRHIIARYEDCVQDCQYLMPLAYQAIVFFSDTLTKRKHTASPLTFELFHLMIPTPIEPNSPLFEPIRTFYNTNSSDPDFQIQYYLKLQTLKVLVEIGDVNNAQMLGKDIQEVYKQLHFSTIFVYNITRAGILNKKREYLEELLLRLRMVRDCVETGAVECGVYSIWAWINGLAWLRDPMIRKDLLLQLYAKYPGKNNITNATLLFELFSLDDRITKPSEKMQYVKKLISHHLSLLTVNQLQAIYFFAGNYSSGMQSRFKESIVFFQHSNYYIHKSWEYLKNLSAYLRNQLTPEQYITAMPYMEQQLYYFSNNVNFQNSAYVETLQADYVKIEELLSKLEELSLTDPLTTLHNRRYMEHNLPQMVMFFFQQKVSISFIMIDIDHFKEVNDVYGHQAGDHILIELGALITKNFRKSDLVIRYGGEEFFAALFDMPKDAVYGIVETLRLAVQNHHFAYKQQVMKITISVGITFREFDSSVEPDLVQITAEADKALYCAKSGGRNRSCFFD